MLGGATPQAGEARGDFSSTVVSKYATPRCSEIVDSMILAYITENEQNITDEEKYTEELTKFKTEFFDFLIKCLKQLRDEKYFESVYPERILINFQVEEYYDNEKKMIHIFEELNTKEETKLFAQFLYG